MLKYILSDIARRGNELDLAILSNRYSTTWINYSYVAVPYDHVITNSDPQPWSPAYENTTCDAATYGFNFSLSRTYWMYQNHLLSNIICDPFSQQPLHLDFRSTTGMSICAQIIHDFFNVCSLLHPNGPNWIFLMYFFGALFALRDDPYSEPKLLGLLFEFADISKKHVPSRRAFLDATQEKNINRETASNVHYFFHRLNAKDKDEVNKYDKKKIVVEHIFKFAGV